VDVTFAGIFYYSKLVKAGPGNNMQQKLFRQPVLLFLIIFFLISLGLLLLKLLKIVPDQDNLVLFSGNLILFLTTTLSFLIYRRTIQGTNIHAFLRAVYGSMFLKMIICIAATLVYVLIARSSVSKLAVFGCLGFYFVYSVAEVRVLIKKNRQKNV
jgi:hypothetical protein